MEEFATRTQLEDDVVILLGLAEFNKLNDVGVVEVAHNLDFFEDIRSLDGLH
jgi:hypothetical protein